MDAVHKSQPAFKGADIAKCYDALHFSKPSSFGGYMSQLVEKKDLLKAGSAHRLENKIREQLEAAYGTPEVTVKITGLLTDLVSSIPDMGERTYYQEALICYKHGSRRGAVVMTWNIAFSHLCEHVLAKRLADFNAGWQVANWAASLAWASDPGRSPSPWGETNVVLLKDLADATTPYFNSSHRADTPPG